MSVTIEKLDTGYLVTSDSSTTTHPGMMGSGNKRAALSTVDGAFDKAREMFDEEEKAAVKK